MKDSTSRRLDWLDLLRLASAIFIVSFHWLRASLKVGALGDPSQPSLVGSYRGNELGAATIGLYAIDRVHHGLPRILDDALGIVFGSGWEAVNVFILLSGFSLAYTLSRRHSGARFWLTWLGRRARRILVPYYLVAALMLAAFAVVEHVAAGRGSGKFAAKLADVVHGPWYHTLLAHIVLFDPTAPHWAAPFFAPAWWFIPAILLAYAVFPLVIAVIERIGMRASLALAACVSVASYALVERGIFVDDNWSFIINQELFTLVLGIVAGMLYRDAAVRERMDAALRSPATLASAIALAVAGNVMLWWPATRPFASMFFTVGLTAAGAYAAMRLEDMRFVRWTGRLDPYDMYLLHQPFAFPLALVCASALHAYATSIGWIVYLGFVCVVTFAFGVGRRALEAAVSHRSAAAAPSTATRSRPSASR